MLLLVFTPCLEVHIMVLRHVWRFTSWFYAMSEGSHHGFTPCLEVHIMVLRHVWRFTSWFYAMSGGSHHGFTPCLEVHTMVLRHVWRFTSWFYAMSEGSHHGFTPCLKVHIMVLRHVWRFTSWFYAMSGGSHHGFTPCLEVHSMVLRHVWRFTSWFYAMSGGSSLYRFDIFHVAWQGILHLLWKISLVYVIASRLCEHSNLVRFEKRAAKTLQHGHRYGDILILYAIRILMNDFFCYKWHKICSCSKSLDISGIYYFLVKYAIQISNMNEL